MKTCRKPLTVLLVLFLFVAALSLSASADGISWYALYDEETNPLGIGFGLIYNGSKRVFLCPDLGESLVCVNGADSSAVYGVREIAAKAGYFGFYTAVEGTTAESEILCDKCESPQKDESIHILFGSEDGIMSIQARVTDDVQESDGGKSIRLDCPDGRSLGSSGILPWIAYNANANCVGVVYQSGSSYMLYTQWFDQSAFSGGASSETPRDNWQPEVTVPESVKLPVPEKTQSSGKQGLAAAIIALVVMLGAAAWFISTKKTKGTKSSIVSKEKNAPAKRLYLACRGGYQEGRLYPLDGTVTIGRSRDNDIQYPADYPGVSRHHVTVSLKTDAGGRRVWLEDKSSMGTYLKKASIGETKAFKLQTDMPVELHIGDAFYLAERENKYELIEKE